MLRFKTKDLASSPYQVEFQSGKIIQASVGEGLLQLIAHVVMVMAY
jgi:hypothetical protein